MSYRSLSLHQLLATFGDVSYMYCLRVCIAVMQELHYVYHNYFGVFNEQYVFFILIGCYVNELHVHGHLCPYGLRLFYKNYIV